MGNPTMMGMMPTMMTPMMGMSPMMAMNPMMMMMMAGMAGAAGKPPNPCEGVDPRVRRLCRDFDIDDNTCVKLDEAMKQREHFDEDIQALYQVMQRQTAKGKKPLEAMLTQIRSIKAGRFAGRDLLDKDIWAFAEKYDLDDRVLNRLIALLKTREETRRRDLKALDDRLGNASQPTGLGLLVRLIEGLEETGRLPSPPRRLGGSGQFHATGTFLNPSGGPSRSSRRRSRSRTRSRSRSRSRRRPYR